MLFRWRADEKTALNFLLVLSEGSSFLSVAVDLRFIGMGCDENVLLSLGTKRRTSTREPPSKSGRVHFNYVAQVDIIRMS